MGSGFFRSFLNARFAQRTCRVKTDHRLEDARSYSCASIDHPLISQRFTAWVGRSNPSGETPGRRNSLPSDLSDRILTHSWTAGDVWVCGRWIADLPSFPTAWSMIQR